jgi:hypothetical protein
MADKDDWKRAFFAALSGTAAVGPIDEGGLAQLHQDTEASRIVQKAAHIADLATAEIARRDKTEEDVARTARVAQVVRQAEAALTMGSSVTLHPDDPAEEILAALRNEGFDAEIHVDTDFKERSIIKRKS